MMSFGKKREMKFRLPITVLLSHIIFIVKKNFRKAAADVCLYFGESELFEDDQIYDKSFSK